MYDIIIGRSQDDAKEFGTAGTIFIGKHYVKMGQTTSLSNKVYMDVAKSHVVFVVGKRGSGKCLHEDSLITLSNGLEVPIKQLFDNNDEILALNHNLKLTNSKKMGFYTRKVDKLLHIKLRSGKEIKLTPEHPLLTVRGWQKAENLQVGSRIATPRKLDFFGNEAMPEHEIKILAYMIAEGHIKKPLFFTNYDDTIVKDLESSLKLFDGYIEIMPLSKKGQYQISSRKKRMVLGYNIIRDSLGRISKGSSISNEKNSIRQFFEKYDLYSMLSKEKSVPKIIFELTKNKIALFLSRLFSCDGSIYKPKKNSNYWEVSYSSSSEKLAKQVQSLLLRFGILAKLRTKKIYLKDNLFLSYELVIDGENVLRFLNEIGFFGEKEKKQGLALKEMSELKRNPNIDTIPKEIWEIYRPKSWVTVGKEFNYKSPKALRSSINYAPSRQKLLQIALTDNNDRMKLLAESDIFWDEIVSMEILLGEFEVFDISVPDLHNFVANNIIVHNSYTMGVIAESILDLPEEVRDNISIIILDTMGIYWTMKYPNKQDKELLEEWELEAKPLHVNIFTPVGYYKKYQEGDIPTDFPFSIKTSELSAYEWAETFGIELHSPIGSLIERVIENFRENNEDYDVDDIIKAIQKDDRSSKEIKDAAENRFLSAKHWGLFSKQGTLLEDLVMPGQITVLDVSCYTYMPGAESLRALVIGLVAQKLFAKRMMTRKAEEYGSIYRETHLIEKDEEQKKEPAIWLIIDEAHEFLPNEGSTVATQPLITILREGRQPGISLVLASQQPGKIHTDVITQSDVVIAHRVTANVDVQALGSLMQSYMREGLDKQINYLPRVTGAALVFDDANEKIYPMRIRPRYTWHGGETPSVLLKKKKIFEI